MVFASKDSNRPFVLLSVAIGMHFGAITSFVFWYLRFRRWVAFVLVAVHAASCILIILIFCTPHRFVQNLAGSILLFVLVVLEILVHCYLAQRFNVRVSRRLWLSCLILFVTVAIIGNVLWLLASFGDKIGLLLHHYVALKASIAVLFNVNSVLSLLLFCSLWHSVKKTAFQEASRIAGPFKHMAIVSLIRCLAGIIETAMEASIGSLDVYYLVFLSSTLGVITTSLACYSGMLVGSPAFSLPTYVQQIDQSKRQTTSKHDGLPTQTDQHQSTSPTAFASSTSFFETKSPMEPSFHSPSTNILTLAPTSLSSVTVDIEAVLGVQKDLSGVTAKLLVVTLTGGQNRFQLVCEDWRSIQKWGSVWRRRLEELIGDQACQHATRLSKTGGAGGHAIFVPEKVLEDIVRSSEARQTLLDGGSILYQPVQG